MSDAPISKRLHCKICGALLANGVCPYPTNSTHEIHSLKTQLAALAARLEAAEQERKYFMNDIYEFGCCQFNLCASAEDRRRAHGFIWQRICILKDAIKHGSRAALSPPAGGAEEGRT